MKGMWTLVPHLLVCVELPSNNWRLGINVLGPVQLITELNWTLTHQAFHIQLKAQKLLAGTLPLLKSATRLSFPLAGMMLELDPIWKLPSFYSRKKPLCNTFNNDKKLRPQIYILWNTSWLATWCPLLNCSNGSVPTKETNHLLNHWHKCRYKSW